MRFSAFGSQCVLLLRRTIEATPLKNDWYLCYLLLEQTTCMQTTAIRLAIAESRKSAHLMEHPSPEVIYKAKDDDEQIYTGLTEGTFKQRYNNHWSSFCQRKYKESTELSKHIWKLKDGNTPYTVAWLIHRRAAAYNGRRRCSLCLAEKLAIISTDTSSSLNRRSELVSK